MAIRGWDWVPSNWTGIEVLGWYDWIAYWIDDKWQRRSRVALIPIGENEMCKYGNIYKVSWSEEDNIYHIISQREDKE